MRFVSAIVAATLSLTAGGHGWTQDPGNGIWVANNHFYQIRGLWVHESCTRMNTDHVHLGGKCSFWKDAIGNMYGGKCTTRVPGQVLCLS